MKKFKRIKQSEFTQIKALLNAQVRPSVVQQITGRSNATVSAVGKAQTLEEYHQIVSNRRSRYIKNQTTPQKQQPAVNKLESLTEVLTDLHETMKETNQLLEKLLNKKRLF